MVIETLDIWVEQGKNSFKHSSKKDSAKKMKSLPENSNENLVPRFLEKLSHQNEARGRESEK